MKNLISKEEKDRIDSICEKFNILKYKINSNGSIDVDGSVTLNNIGVKQLPLKFNTVSGDFICTSESLTTLEGCPQTVGGVFNCSRNFELSSLVGGPTSVGSMYFCFSSSLLNLVGSPSVIKGDFLCSDNQLTSLVGCPTTVGGYYMCHTNKLTSTYSGDNDIEFIGEGFRFSDNLLPQQLDDNLDHIKLILKYQRHFMIWNDDLTLNEENFND